MIEHPENYAEAFKKAGAQNLTVHLEACTHLHRNIQQIKSLGMEAGVAINPHTPVHFLKHILKEIDLVCIMSVNPGFGGQAFIPQTIDKVKELKTMIVQSKATAKIEIDGGVTLENAGALIEAGADVLVAGNTIFKSPHPIETIAALKAL
jgi:ribulose-phosphate 3-epimerase